MVYVVVLLFRKALDSSRVHNEDRSDEVVIVFLLVSVRDATSHRVSLHILVSSLPPSSKVSSPFS